MLKTTKILLAIASLLTVSATAMAAQSTHRSHRTDMRAAASESYDARAQAPGAFYGAPVNADEQLFDRAKGGIEY